MEMKQKENLNGGAPQGQNSPHSQVKTERNNEQCNYQYYEEYKRLYQTAYCLSLQLRQLTQAKEDIWLKITRLEKKTEDFKDDIRGEPAEKKKRFRRTAEEIQKKYVCQVEKCQRSYGSEGSLQQHIKLKHPQLYESKLKNRLDRESEGDQ